MSAYNASRYITDAISSILDQRFVNFEFIIINDGSSDDTLMKIKDYSDPKIIIIDQKNQGLVTSLNNGVALARAPIIARQDADDISLPDRLRLQYDALINNKSMAIIGSSVITINDKGTEINQHKVLLGDAELKQELLVRSPFAHGSVMFRKKAFEEAGKYQKDDWPAEDYGLWLRMSSYGTFANIDIPQYKYRENPAGISARNESKQVEVANSIRRRAWENHASLQPFKIDAAKYRKLPMGEYRIERIFKNITTIMILAARRLSIVAFLKGLIQIFSSRVLIRKMMRHVLIRLKLKHV